MTQATSFTLAPHISGSSQRTAINDMMAAFNTTQRGNFRPSTATGGSMWIDDSGGASAWLLKMFDGTDDITIGTINTTANTFTPAGQAAAFASGVSSKTATHSLGLGDYGTVILCNATSGAIVSNIDDPSTLGSGWYAIVQKTDATANTVTIDPYSTNTINGATTLLLNRQWDTAILVKNGNNIAALIFNNFYDPTAVAITGGTMAGVAISGGSIENSPIGQSTPNLIKGTKLQSVGSSNTVFAANSVPSKVGNVEMTNTDTTASAFAALTALLGADALAALAFIRTSANNSKLIAQLEDAGTVKNALELLANGALALGGATGGTQGAGTINAKNYYKDGSVLDFIGFKGMQIIKTSATYTPSSGTTRAVVIGIGGGSCSGSVQTAGSDTVFGTYMTCPKGGSGGARAADSTFSGVMASLSLGGSVGTPANAAAINNGFALNPTGATGGPGLLGMGAGQASTSQSPVNTAVPNTGAGGGSWSANAAGSSGSVGICLINMVGITSVSVTIGAGEIPFTTYGSAGTGVIIVLEF